MFGIVEMNCIPRKNLIRYLFKGVPLSAKTYNYVFASIVLFKIYKLPIKTTKLNNLKIIISIDVIFNYQIQSIVQLCEKYNSFMNNM